MRCVVGIDFSIGCPGLCVHIGDTWSAANCKYYYLYKVKKWLLNNHYVNSDLFPKYECQEERLDWITSYLATQITSLKSPEVYIEEYSYSTASSSTHILAEGCGLLKHKLWKHDIRVHELGVTTIKKFAGKHGHANKEAMFDAFLNERSSLQGELPFPIGKSPLADLVDAHFIAKLGFTQS